MSHTDGPGTVYLVGSIPGAPGLLTRRAERLLAGAGAVVVAEEGGLEGVLEICDRGADVQRLPAAAGAAEAVEALARLAAGHARVVRLYGDDPFLLPAGVAEAAALAARGIPLEVVPGVSRALAAAALAGIPLAAGGAEARPEGGAGGAPPPVSVRVGAAAPEAGGGAVAEVEAAGTPYQRVWSPPDVAPPPALGASRVVVTGEAARPERRIPWLERRPLQGRRVVVTRSRSQGEEMVEELAELGAEVLHFPTIRIEPPTDPGPLAEAVRDVGSYAWVVFTSVNGVERFWAALREAGRDTRALGGVSLCAIGPATAAAVAREGATADLVPEEYVAEAVVAALAAAAPLPGCRILLPRAEVARDVLPDSLRALGAELTEVAAYRTVAPREEAAPLRARLHRGEIDLLTFTASSTVRNFVDAVGSETGGARVAAIGPITADTARSLGLPVHVVAEDYTIPGLLRAIRRAYARTGEHEA